MEKQLLIYERAVPLAPSRHGAKSLAPLGGYGFARDVNSVPLVASEAAQAARELAIVFAGKDGNVMPAVVFGMRDGNNHYIDADGRWKGRYVPAFLRRYPFVFSRASDGEGFTLCIDESCGGLNEEDRGERLFTDAGEPTDFTKRALEFSREYQSHYLATKTLCDKLGELGVLEPAQARFPYGEGQTGALGGFMTVNRDKLRALDEATLGALAKSGALEFCHLHLFSLANLDPIARGAAAKAEAATSGGAPGGAGSLN